MPDDILRTRIATALLGDHCVQGMTAPCDDCRAHALRQADKVIRELTNPIRGCTDLWHWSTGKPYQCPSCGYRMGEGYV